MCCLFVSSLFFDEGREHLVHTIFSLLKPGVGAALSSFVIPFGALPRLYTSVKKLCKVSFQQASPKRHLSELAQDKDKLCQMQIKVIFSVTAVLLKDKGHLLSDSCVTAVCRVNWKTGHV